MRIDRRSVVLSAGVLAACGPSPDSTAAPAASAGASEGEIFIGPLPGWKNVRTDFGAVGDGRADDTAALQRALDSLITDGSTALYLPAGRYRITRTLMLPRKGAREAQGLSIQGEDPATTVLVWDGPRDGRMIEYGAWYSRLGRLTFDGAGRAGIALAHGPKFVTANEIADCWFQDVGVGIEAGTPENAGIAETTVNRCRFLRCAVAGASLRNFNSLDWWFWRCRFEDCRLGVTNLYGAGNFHVFDSVFLRSGEADIAIRNTGFLSFRDNLSIGSKAFFVARAVDAAAEVTLQRNRIIDATDVAAIRVANFGPLILLDNTIVSRPGQAGPVVEGRSAIGLAIGNRVTVAQAVALKSGSTVLDEVRIPRPRRVEMGPPPPPPARRETRQVQSVAAGTAAVAIQALIDGLVRRGGGVIHFAPGVHAIDRTLTLPAGADLTLIGDGIPTVTQLVWAGAGAGPILALRAPSRVRLENLALSGQRIADGVALTGVDAAQGQILFHQTKAGSNTEAGYQIERLTRAEVVMRNIDHFGNRTGLRIIGAGAGRANRPVVIVSGASSDNDVSYDLSAGARLLARDIWYESGGKPGFLALAGAAEFTLNGSNIATPRKAGAPAVRVDGFQGRALFLGVVFTATGGSEAVPAVSVTGGEAASNLAVIGGHGSGEWYADQSAGGRALRLHGQTYASGGGARPLPDRGAADPDFIREMLLAARAPTPSDLAHVRFTRVYFGQCRIGARITA